MTVGIYIITNVNDQKNYVGSSFNIEKRWKSHLYGLKYGRHHNIILQRIWNKYGEGIFEFTIIEEIHDATLELLFEREEFHMQRLRSRDCNYGYNLAPAGGGDLISHHPNRSNIIQKMTESLRRHMMALSPENRKKIYGKPDEKNGMYGKTHTEESRKIISDKVKKWCSHNENYKSGKNHVEVFGERRAAEISKKFSEIASKRVGDKNPFYGKSHTEITKNKLSVINKTRGYVGPQERPVIVNDVEYKSLSEASRVLGVVPATVLNRIRNPKFPEYTYKSSDINDEKTEE